MLPFIAIGLVVGLGCARPLNALGLGEDTARALGARVGWTRAVDRAWPSPCCAVQRRRRAVRSRSWGSSCRWVRAPSSGPDQRWLLPYSAFLGPILLVTCDTVGRVVARPSEVQVGIMTAALGGPAFVLLVRRVRMAQL